MKFLWLLTLMQPAAPGSDGVLWHAEPAAECAVHLESDREAISVEVRPGEVAIHGDAGQTQLAPLAEHDTGFSISGGPVRVELPATCAVTVQSVTGDLSYRLAPDQNAEIKLATSGRISTDFSVTIEYLYHQEPAKRGNISVGQGGTRVDLATRRGSVGILAPR